jgi:uncharacterized membrane protein YfcA
MTADPIVLAVAVPAVLFAGISKGGFGSGAAFAATPILALVLDPATALGLMLPLLMLIDLVTMRSFWGRWHGPSAAALILGGLPGVALGLVFFEIAPPDLIRLMIGAIALAFVAWQVARGRGWIRVPDAPFRWATGMIAGTVGGFTSFVSHAGGPPVAVFLLAQGLGKTTYQATTVVTFWAVNLVKAVPYGLFGFFTVETLTMNLWLAPVAVAGAWLGIRAHHRVPERVFFAITYVLLTATGAKLVWDGLA